jgi:hypothetical protein
VGVEQLILALGARDADALRRRADALAAATLSA